MGIKDLTKISMMTAVLAVLGVIPPIPLPISPVPITIQSVAPMMIGGVLGGKRGGLSVLLFIFLVACSLPLLAGGRGGIGFLFGPTGGYIFGWAVVAFGIGFCVTRLKHKSFIKVFSINLLFGLGVLYVCGASYLAATSGMGFGEALWLNVFYIPGDVVKALLATVITLRVLKAMPTI
ncbi:biotin transporter BioY [Shouchella sp. JSM 1781072]|uniref:biotin transporter BioY n=1 Tax=Bacillaceae TaxID=186817 RepID=UPI00159BC5B4|nr:MULTISPECIES: biotin transporter BioY [Bacillaceae]UTR05087.1 biotin transporter BioY [Alkalihalobacillus sp. LMS6]